MSPLLLLTLLGIACTTSGTPSPTCCPAELAFVIIPLSGLAGYVFSKKDSRETNVGSKKLRKGNETTLYGRIDDDAGCPAIGGVDQYPIHYYKDPKISVCAPYCIDGNCPPALAANEPVCDDPPVCIILCDEDADCQEGALCIETDITGVCAFNTTKS
ncbi:hypothetical protein FOL47_007264 [Perkinsus chesapeaki]|uniref:Uncharacterized protein n=1 Tax=Perkinsus chesapeaki TaxID=330153 RepID=A0A7J6LLQ7_PERCH|nr:hypothetical protein FOL47_007264 [Perkinsus chesapeaki]